MDNTPYKLYRIFLRYCGPSNDVTEKNFVKLCKDYGVLDGEHVTITDAEMAFQIKVNTGYNMEYDEFKETVRSLAKLGSHTADEMFEKMISMPPPPVEKQVKRKVSREATGSSTSDVTKEEKANTYRRSSSSKAVRRNSSGTKTENMKTKDLKSSSSGSLPQRIHKRAMNIVSRLTNPSTYTGTQKERFEKIEKEKQAKPPEPEKDQSLLDFLRERRSSLAMPAENKKVLDLDSFLQQMLGTDPAEASTSSENRAHDEGVRGDSAASVAPHNSNRDATNCASELSDVHNAKTERFLTNREKYGGDLNAVGMRSFTLRQIMLSELRERTKSGKRERAGGKEEHVGMRERLEDNYDGLWSWVDGLVKAESRKPASARSDGIVVRIAKERDLHGVCEIPIVDFRPVS